MSQFNLRITGRRLGKGGFGSVYLGFVGKEPVAVKVLDDMKESSFQRFTREQEIMIKLAEVLPKGFYIPILHANGTLQDGRPFYVMPYYVNGSLDKYTEKLEPDRALTVLATIAELLEVAHSHGIIHNDLKERNILIGDDGIPLIADWGLAFFDDSRNLTSDGAAPGTDGYRAPEIGVARDARKNPTSDIYSLGVILQHISMPHHVVNDLIDEMMDPDTENRIQDCPDLIAAIGLAKERIRKQEFQKQKKKALRQALREMELRQKQQLAQQERNENQGNLLKAIGLLAVGFVALGSWK